MYVPMRGAFIRNVAVAAVNGVVTLVLLLIAPLGLAAVITNTGLVAISTFLISTFADLIVVWLLRPSQPESLSQGSRRVGLTNLEQSQDIKRRP